MMFARTIPILSIAAIAAAGFPSAALAQTTGGVAMEPTSPSAGAPSAVMQCVAKTGVRTARRPQPTFRRDSQVRSILERIAPYDFSWA